MGRNRKEKLTDPPGAGAPDLEPFNDYSTDFEPLPDGRKARRAQIVDQEEKASERRSHASFEAFLNQEPYRALIRRLQDSLPLRPASLKSQNRSLDPKAHRRRVARVLRQEAQRQALEVKLTVGDVEAAIEAVKEAQECAGIEQDIHDLWGRLGRAREIWNSSGDTKRRAVEACTILFGAEKGRRRFSRTALRYAWNDFTACELWRITGDSQIGWEWQRKTWGELQLEPPPAADPSERIVASLRRLPERERRQYALEVIQKIFGFKSAVGCEQNLRESGIENVPAQRR